MQRELYAEFQPETYEVFNELMKLARSLNTHIDPPEFVFLGVSGVGKTSLIEAFLGHTFSRSGKATKRPLQISFSSNLECDAPKLTLRRDAFLSSKGAEFEHDVEIEIDMIANELQKRNITTSIPIYLQYEHKNFFNMVMFDTQPIPPSVVGKVDKKQAKKESKSVNALLKMIAPNNRILVVVEQAGTHQEEVEEFVKQVDPKLERTLFVSTNFQEHLATLSTSQDVNKYLGGLQSSAAGCFVVSLPALQKKTVAKYSKSDSFKKNIQEGQDEDLRKLESLMYDRRFSRNVGFSLFRNHVLQTTWKHYQERMPVVLENLSNKLKQVQMDINHVTESLSMMEPYRLRTTATNYAMSFLQNLEKLIKGTLEGIPNQNGQTFFEEIDEEEAGPWTDSAYKAIAIDTKSWNIPYAENKLYGKQQYERLLSQFRSVAEHTNMAKVSLDEVACSAGPNKISTVSNFAWAASDLAQRNARKAFLPLVKQLCERSIYVLKRLVIIVDKMMQTAKKASLKRGAQARSGPMASPSSSEDSSANEFPYFTHNVKNLYYAFVEQAAKDCLRRCMDDFYCTQIVYWDTVNFSKHKFPKESFNMEIYEQQEEVIEIARVIFEDVRERITQNVLLKFHSYFYMPMQNDLWGAVQGKVTALDDQALAELFQVDANKSTLQGKQKSLIEDQQNLIKLQTQLQVSSSKFSHPK